MTFQDSFRESLLTTRVHYAAGAGIGVLALHAGIERGTGEVAQEVARRTGATLLSFWQPSADRRHHVTSARFDPDDCPELREFLRVTRLVVSLHGHQRRTHHRHVFVGGGNRPLAARLAGLLRPRLATLSVTANLRTIPPGLRGLHPLNPVNRPVDGGVQLELPACARGLGGGERPLPSSAPDHTLREDLTATLCRFVESRI